MRHHIRVLAFGAEPAEQQHAADQRRPAHDPARAQRIALVPGVRREQSERREHRRGSTDRAVRYGSELRFEAIRRRGREQRQQPCGAGAQPATREISEPRARHEIRDEVRRVDVQRERRDRAPPVTLADQRGVGDATRIRIERPEARADREADCQQGERKGGTAHPGERMAGPAREGWRPGRYAPFDRLTRVMLARFGGARRIDEQRVTCRGQGHEMPDADGGEDEGAFRAGARIVRHEHGDGRFGLRRAPARLVHQSSAMPRKSTPSERSLR